MRLRRFLMTEPIWMPRLDRPTAPLPYGPAETVPRQCSARASGPLRDRGGRPACPERRLRHVIRRPPPIGRQVAGMDHAVHGHPRPPHPIRDLGDREHPLPVLGHGVPFPLTTSRYGDAPAPAGLRLGPQRRRTSARSAPAWAPSRTARTRTGGGSGTGTAASATSAA